MSEENVDTCKRCNNGRYWRFLHLNSRVREKKGEEKGKNSEKVEMERMGENRKEEKR